MYFFAKIGNNAACEKKQHSKTILRHKKRNGKGRNYLL